MTPNSGFGSAERGVSDVIGYVLIFSLIVATVGVVTTVGFSTLDDRQDAERINNAERAFDVFANNMQNVYRDGAPSRATEMRLAGGELQYGEPVTITVSNPENPSTNTTIQTTPLVYADSGTEIVYVAGAVIRDQGDSAVLLRDPPFRFGSDRTLVPLIQTTDFPGRTTVSAGGTARIGARSIDRTPVPESGLAEAGEIRISVTTPRTDVWERYFEQQQAEIGGEVLVNDDVSYTFDTGEFSTPLSRIQLRLGE